MPLGAMLGVELQGAHDVHAHVGTVLAHSLHEGSRR